MEQAARKQPHIEYALEPCASLWAELIPLTEAHYAEVGYYRDTYPLDPDYEGYEAAEAAGLVYWYTARVDGKLVGYVNYIVGPNLHYRGSLHAKQDLLFVAREHRNSKIGYWLVAHSHHALKAMGVQVVYQHTKVAPEHNIGSFFKRLGYELIDEIYGKRLD